MGDGLWARASDAVRRARAFSRERARGRTRLGRTLTVVVCLLAGTMMGVSATQARGTDLRPGRNTDLVGLVQARSRAKADLAARVAAERAEVDRLSSDSGGTDPELRRRLAEVSELSGMVPVRGPAVTVTLSDAPSSVQAQGLDQDLLVVHQQDIQAAVNVLWAAGAEAMTIQGQRVTATTGIKCVGNTVVLHGTPYAPPYVITAIGDPARLERGLASSEFLRIYRQYADAYRLGYEQRTDAQVTLPAGNAAGLRFARPA